MLDCRDATFYPRQSFEIVDDSNLISYDLSSSPPVITKSILQSPADIILPKFHYTVGQNIDPYNLYCGGLNYDFDSLTAWDLNNNFFSWDSSTYE